MTVFFLIFHTVIIINSKNWRTTIKLHFENLSIFFKKNERTHILGPLLPLFIFVCFSMTSPSPPQRMHFLNEPSQGSREYFTSLILYIYLILPSISTTLQLDSLIFFDGQENECCC